MEDYTHYLICFENVGNGKKRRYFDLCKVLKESTTGQLVIQVKSKRGKITKRYVDAERLIDIYEPC